MNSKQILVVFFTYCIKANIFALFRFDTKTNDAFLYVKIDIF